MIRKQLYIGEEHERKLKRLAAAWHCPEAEVVRRAVEQLPEPKPSLEEQIRERLRQAGALMERRDYPDLPTKEEANKRLQRLRKRLAARKKPLALSEAVLEERRESW